MSNVIKYRGKCYEVEDDGEIYIGKEVNWVEGAEDFTGRIDWRKDRGDDNLGIEYPLGKDSVVVEVGGYLGDWADRVREYYDSKIWILEPVDEYYLKLLDRFKGNHKVRVLNKGLSDKTGIVDLGLEGDKTRVEGDGEGKHRAYVMDAGEFFRQFEVVDLVQINCEGAEYGIFNRLFETGQVDKIKNIKVQFHKITPASELSRSAIRDILGLTHKQTYCYDWVWENWERI